MKKIIVAFGFFTAGGAASQAAAQDTRRPVTSGEVRPVLRRVDAPRAGYPAPYQPAPRYTPAERTVEVVDLAATIIATVQLGRWLGTHPELLPPAGASSRPAPPAARRPPVRRAAAATSRFGLKAGLNLATITGAHPADIKAIAGLSAGFMADFGLGKYFAFHPELLYDQKGGKGSIDVLSGLGFSEEERLHYLDLPLLLRARASGFFFEAGPQLGYLLAQKSSFTTTVPGFDPETSTSTGLEGTRRFDVGYVLGLGYALPQGWELGVRYNGGLSDIRNPAGDPKLRNSVFQVQAGYLF